MPRKKTRQSCPSTIGLAITDLCGKQPRERRAFLQGDHRRVPIRDKTQRKYFDGRSERYTHAQEQRRPHVGGNERNHKARDDGPQRNRQFLPTTVISLRQKIGISNTSLVTESRPYQNQWAPFSSLSVSCTPLRISARRCSVSDHDDRGAL